MDETAFGEGVEPVDLEVRAHVYSLVTAVSILRAAWASVLIWVANDVAARRIQWRRCG